jgi:excinuclease ABC subunit A
MIEHNLDVIKNCDWVVDLGPEGGEEGGEVLFEGLLEDLKNCKKSYTAEVLNLMESNLNENQKPKNS